MGREKHENHPLRDTRILIAEDEFLIALDLEAIMRDAGADIVGPFSTVPTAVKAAREEPFSVAVLDVRLGRETTLAIAEILNDREIPFLFYSGQLLPEGIRAVSPDAPLLAKPVDQRILIETLARLLGR